MKTPIGTLTRPQETCIVIEDGEEFVELPFTVPWYFLAAAGVNSEGLELAMSADYDFEVRAVSAVIGAPGPLAQIQWTDGRYLSNPGLPVFDFIGTGERGFLLENPELIPRGAKVKVNVSNL